MDSTEKQHLMDEFGSAGQADHATPAEPEATTAPDGASAQNEPTDGVQEFDPVEFVDDNETTLTDGLVVDIIHDVDVPVTTQTAAIGDDPRDRELAENRDRLLRLAAEFENFKKRRMREREDQQKFANERLLKDFLPVLDNLERALDSARQSGQGQAITAGLDLVIHEFLNVLSREGVTVVDSVGKPFDPALQDALQQIETADMAPGTVYAEVLKGYMLNGRVLRAALVVVAREPQNRD